MMKRHTRLLSFVSAEVDKLDNQNLPSHCHNQNKLNFRIHKVKWIKVSLSGLGNYIGVRSDGQAHRVGEKGVSLSAYWNSTQHSKISLWVKGLVVSFTPLHSSQFQRPEKDKWQDWGKRASLMVPERKWEDFWEETASRKKNQHFPFSIHLTGHSMVAY